MPHDVFISYASRDKATADAVCHALEADGVRCWIAPRDALPGRKYQGSIVRAIRECRAMVLVFSGGANDSEHVTREVSIASDHGKPVIPFRIEAVEMSDDLYYYISSVHWLDALTPPLEHHVERLVEAVASLIPRSETERGEAQPQGAQPRQEAAEETDAATARSSEERKPLPVPPPQRDIQVPDHAGKSERRPQGEPEPRWPVVHGEAIDRPRFDSMPPPKQRRSKAVRERTLYGLAGLGAFAALLVGFLVANRSSPPVQAATLVGHTDMVLSVDFSPDGRTLASASLDSTVRLWDVRTAREVGVIEAGDMVSAVAFSPNGRILATSEGEIDALGGSRLLLREMPGHRVMATVDSYWSALSIAFHPDGRSLAAIGADGSVALLEVPTGRRRATLEVEGNPWWSLAYSPDGRLLAATADSSVWLWEVPSGRHVATLTHSHQVISLAFSPDGSILATGNEGHRVRLWEMPEGRPFATLEGHRDPIFSLTFSPDGRMLASAESFWSFKADDYRPGQIRLWEMPGGRPLRTLDGHEAPIWSIAFSPDSRTLASADWDGTVRLWPVR